MTIETSLDGNQAPIPLPLNTDREPVVPLTMMPTLSKSTREWERTSRISELGKSVRADPERFAQACRNLGELGAIYMTDTSTFGAGVARKEDVMRLRTFLDENDFRHTVFDDESDDAIYSHPGVMSLVHSLGNKSAQTQRVKQGQNYVPRENAYAVRLRNSATALKLFLFAERVAEWQKQQQLIDSTRDDSAS